MSDAREQVRNGLLLDGLGRPIDLNAVDRPVRHHSPSATPTDVQSETPGEVADKTERFITWRRSLDYSIRKITHSYVKHNDDPERWMFSAWLSLTTTGQQLARSFEEKDIDGCRRKTP